PTVWRSTPPLPEVSIPWSTSRTRRSEPVVRSAQSISCRSDSSSPSANRAALPLVLPPSNPGDASVGIAARSTAPGGRRWRWATVMGPSCRIVVDRPELVAHHRERHPRGVALAGQQARQPPGRGGGVDAAQRPQLLADQGAGGLL